MGKDVYTLISQIGGYSIEGFLDLDRKPDVVMGKTSVKVFPESHLATLGYEPMLAIGVGDPKALAKIAAKFGDRYTFPNLIHPNVTGFFEGIAMGAGNIISAGCVLTSNITIGSFNIFNWCVTVGHDVTIGNFNVINPSVNVSGGVEIGNTNLVGVNATILQYKRIGSQSVVGAAALVTKDVADKTLVMGVPAEVRRKLD